MEDVDLEPEQRARLERHLDEVAAWNERINLTRVPRERAWERHVDEALALLALAAPRPGGRLCDVGSGAGFPGIPIAVVRSDLHVTLCDADARRSAFLLHCRGLLALDNVRVVTRRAEEMGRDAAERGTHDAVVARALAAPAVACELGLPLVRVGGALHLLVTDAASAAEATGRAAVLCGGGVPVVSAPGILTVTKIADTPDAYPRRVGVPSRRPL